jgi:cytochrome c peroxidase
MASLQYGDVNQFLILILLVKKTSLLIVGLVLAVLSSSYFISCKKYDTGPTTTLQQIIPPGFPQPVYKFADNPLTEEGFELGRKLFYDGRLSLDGNFPCASCHQQSGIFGTFEHDRSHGYGGSHTLRNAPALFNLAWQKELHWDGAFKTLTDEANQPITTHSEMAGNFLEIINKLRKDEEYKKMFAKAFGSPAITGSAITKALAQFTGSIVSYNSRYDRMLNGQATFSNEEQHGYQLFQSKCISCHPPPMFTDYSYHNTGLPIDSFLFDFGRMRITHKSEDSLKFKTPSLRNVEMTSNYVHDGRFNTMYQVLNHYISGIQNSPTLDPLLVNKIPMTISERNDIVSFLRTLSDSSMLTNSRYSKPN